MLLGNSPDIIQATNNPETFFKLLDKLKIYHPETIFSPPVKVGGWLVKQANSCGGLGVEIFDPDQTYSTSSYFQQFVRGRISSVVFVANSQNVKIIGYNEIWNDKAFTFSGAITLPDFPENQSEIIKDYLQLITNELGLVGLCGMDFIIDDQERVQVIEINTRPTATFELHDKNRDLILQHINACQHGKLSSNRGKTIDYRYAKQVLYTEHPLKIDRELQWPPWTNDLPRGNQVIEAFNPVCTVYAEGKSMEETKKLLLDRKFFVKEMLGIQA
jgi:predicted ATP-grasp superfamily ATP-dependent carboligase